MKLFIKREVFGENSRFSVLDCDCKEKYRAAGFLSGLSEKVVIIDNNQLPVLTIKRLSVPFVDTFSITAGEENYRIVLTKSRSKINCKFYGISWRIRGDLLTKSYDIIDADNTVIATHIKRWSSCGAGCELNIFEESRELFCIAAALCINSLQITEAAAPQPL